MILELNHKHGHLSVHLYRPGQMPDKEIMPKDHCVLLQTNRSCVFPNESGIITINHIITSRQKGLKTCEKRPFPRGQTPPVGQAVDPAAALVALSALST